MVVVQWVCSHFTGGEGEGCGGEPGILVSAWWSVALVACPVCPPPAAPRTQSASIAACAASLQYPDAAVPHMLFSDSN